jgi:Flp pilus assembly protein TadD
MAWPLDVTDGSSPAAGRLRTCVAAIVLLLASLAPASAQRVEQGIEALNRGEYDLAIVYFDEAIKLDPADANAHYHRGQAHVAKAEYEMAILDYSEAIRLDPTDGRAYNNRGAAYSRKGDYDRAISDHAEAIRLNPSHARAIYNRGVAYGMKGDHQKAIADYDEATRLDPTDPRPFNNMAWIWATSPRADLRNGQKAIEHATRACELTTWNNWITLGTLAAAYAEAGRFGEAVKWQTAVLQVPDLSESDRVRFQNRLALFEQGKPYREGH